MIRRLVLLIAAAALLAGLAVAPASGAGVTQVSGIAEPGVDMGGNFLGPCNAADDPFAGQGGAEYAIAFPANSGDLEGCIYGANAEYKLAPSGVYKEVADEVFVGSWGDLEGTFSLRENFHTKFTETGQMFGFCQHPIVKGSGTGDFEDITGILHFRDDLEAGNFPYKGQLRFA